MAKRSRPNLLAALAIAGGASVVGGYLISKYAQGTQGQPCVSNYQCGPGFQCVNGICQRCQRQNCSCSQIWDPVNCACGDLIPAAVLAPISAVAQMAFAVQYDCNTGLVPSALHYGSMVWSSPCPSNFPPVGGTVIQTVITGQVTDSSGHAICNQQVNVQPPSQSSFPFQSGEFAGTLDLSPLANYVLTDQNGNFALYVYLNFNLNVGQTLSNLGNCSFCCFGSGGQATWTQNLNLTIGFNLGVNPTIRGATQLQIQAQVCGYYHTGL